jgi:hypothetical protein
MNDREADALARAAQAQGEALYAAQEAIDWEAKAETAYKAMYPESPEDITPRGSGSRRRQQHHHSLVWDAVDWTM